GVAGGLPERLRPRVGRQLGHEVGHLGKDPAAFDGHLLRMSALTGMDAGPPVTRARSAPSTWLTAVPRICSTASRTCVMPMMYASERFPPCVLTGIDPFGHRMLPSATNGPDSPMPQNP